MAQRLKLSTRYGMNTAILIVLAIGIFGIIQVLSYRHHWRKDFTENKRHSLSEQTRNVLGELDGKIKVTVFASKGSPAYEEAQALFDLYKYESDQLEVDLVDPMLNPNMAIEYDVRNYGIPVVFFEGDIGREATTDLNEEAATNALIKVTRGEKKVVCFLTGHGEPSLDNTGEDGLSVVKKLLQDKSYEPRELLLMREEKAPDDCAVLVVCGPKKDLFEPELEAIKQYIEGGGKSAFLLDPNTAPSLTPFLEKFGIVLGDDVVVDRTSRLFGGDSLSPILTNYSAQHPITRTLNIASIFAVARSIETVEVPGIRTTWLAKTGEGSWAESDIEALKQGTASFDPEADTPGPITLVAVAEMDIPAAGEEDGSEAKQAAIVVFGDSEFTTNSRVNLSGNSVMFMNTLNWLGQEEALIAIPPKEAKTTPVVLTASEARMLFLLPVIILPGIVFIGGIYAFVRRSKHP